MLPLIVLPPKLSPIIVEGNTMMHRLQSTDTGKASNYRAQGDRPLTRSGMSPLCDSTDSGDTNPDGGRRLKLSWGRAFAKGLAIA